VLAVTAADADDRFWMLPADPADHGAVFPIRYGGDGAGVDDIAVTGVLKMADFMAPVPQKLFHGLGFILVYLATKGVKCKYHS
jgi:hypothetical protein